MSRTVKDPEERKEELLQIGIDLFLQGGDKNVSIQKVVNRADVATGLFYYYFKTKEEFIEQAHERYLHDYVVDLEKIVCDKEMPVMDRLEFLLKQFNNRFYEVAKMYQSAPPDHPKHFALLEGLIVSKLHQTITGFVKEGCEAGFFKVADPELTALFVVCGLTGILQRINFIENGDANEEIRRLVFSILSI
ncbi:TetR family transcriptional regulator [Kineothrix alysoides]|uniref:TetR family transcriptional regulator n=1 Tax=Kineothrix alysoides TaxID=1469948 RepID=A0A4R1QMR3_9FIRM|nr:TetR/AcrR family transcriptional regulator [Kineothrix alysoides]TCL55028.1 TetR family transcriptional regulator [Kineothrix alysoides]